MNGFVTTNLFPRIFDVPFNFGQTELNRGKMIVMSQFELAINQKFELRMLTINLIRILTPGAIPVYLNTALELCSVGLYRGNMLTGPLAYAAFRDQACSTYAFARCTVATPGIYRIMISNNTSNVDMAVAATGSFKFYY